MLNPKIVKSIEKQIMKIHNGTGFGNVTIKITEFKVQMIAGKETEMTNCSITVSGCV